MKHSTHAINLSDFLVLTKNTALVNITLKNHPDDLNVNYMAQRFLAKGSAFCLGCETWFGRFENLVVNRVNSIENRLSVLLSQHMSELDEMVCPHCGMRHELSQIKTVDACYGQRYQVSLIQDVTQDSLDFVGLKLSQSLLDSQGDRPLSELGFEIVRFTPKFDLLPDGSVELTEASPVRVYVHLLGQKPVARRVEGNNTQGNYRGCPPLHALSDINYHYTSGYRVLRIKDEKHSALVKTGAYHYFTKEYGLHNQNTLASEAVKGVHNLSNRHDLKDYHLYEVIRTQRPGLEQLSKYGFSKFVGDLISKFDTHLHLDALKEATDVSAILGLPKHFVKALKQHEVNPSHSEVYAYWSLFKIEELKPGFTSVFTPRLNFETLHTSRRYLEELMGTYGYSFKEVFEYVERAWLSQALKPSNVFSHWVDYLRMSKDMETPVDRFPRSLVLQHDVLSRDYQYKQDEVITNKFISNMEECQDYQFEDANFIVKLPQTPDELVYEGRHLSHCVASYVERVAEGNTLVLFVRQKDKPETPFITVEWNSGRILQSRGQSNRNASFYGPKVVSFLDKWSAHATKVNEKKQKAMHQAAKAPLAAA